jgi:hypothetical protein
MKQIKLSELKKMYPKHKKEKPQKAQYPVYPEDIDGLSQEELEKYAKNVKKQQENNVTLYPEYHDETKGIYSRAVEVSHDI